MSDENHPELGWLRAAGSPYEIGWALGRQGRKAVHRVLIGSDYWAAVTDPVRAATVARLEARTRALFPRIHAEIQGLADGLDLPFAQVMAWNCRGDLMSNLPDGCTTIQLPGDSLVIAHNEDGLPGFRGHCFVADISPEDGIGFIAACYPGSLPGHTFAVTRAGLAQAVNNLRLRNPHPEIPRMVLGRAVLDCDSVKAALDLLARENACGGFHFTLAQPGEGSIHSVEFGGGRMFHRQITEPSAHANHALHLVGAENQKVTRSSADRQTRCTVLLAGGERDPLAILRDRGGDGLPVHRCAADDPDHENTLATAIIRVEKTGLSWKFYDQATPRPVYSGAQKHH
jgi:hypothetical protein